MSKLSIRTKERKFATAKDLYGLFFEDINRSGDGGLYPEMIRNRSFEDSIAPADCVVEDDGKAFVNSEGWRDQFNNGEGLMRWIRANQTAETPIPAWYTENAEMELELKDTLNEKREAALAVIFEPGGKVYNTGYVGMYFKEGASYHLYFFAKAEETTELVFSLEDENGVLAETTRVIGGNGYVRYDAVMTAKREGENGKLVISCKEGKKVLLGFISLMPTDTYNGHGLRSDLVEKLKGINPSFLRFPGGCIVEGFSPKTVMLFKNVVGPVWERPSHQLMWHYRTSNGIGYHEFLQLCEDLDMEPMYVFNCGMTCQARSPVYFEGEEFDVFVQDLLDALEYALGPADSRWGSLRAQMGHPEPFKMTYLEIGNENYGPEYETRYKIFYDLLREKYPQICLISNTHVEEHGLETDIADEHYYNTTEFFAEGLNFYDEYDRQGPGIFLGEFAVVKGWVGQHYAALGEAMFLIGAERNQDIVKLISYAPLMENVNYQAWFPNFIRFNQKDSLGIPTYYTWRMFGNNRGDWVVASEEETERIYRPVKGGASLMGDPGLQYRNLLWNGEPMEVSHDLMGRVKETADGFVITEPEEVQKEAFCHMHNPDLEHILVVYGDEELREGTFEAEILVEKDREIQVGIYSSRLPAEVYIHDETNPPKDWNIQNVHPFIWKYADGFSSVSQREFPEPVVYAKKDIPALKEGEYAKFSYTVDGASMKLYINGELIHEIAVPSFQAFASVVTDTEDEVIIKTVNIAEKTDPVEIGLDCDVESDYEVMVLVAEKDAINDFENTERVHDVTKQCTGAGRSFVYEAPVCSVSVLKLKKKQNQVWLQNKEQSVWS